MSGKTIWHTYICSHICQSVFIKNQWLKNMKILRGANLWLKNNSKSAPFGPHGAWLSFLEIQCICFILISLIFSVKEKQNMEMILHLGNSFFYLFHFQSLEYCQEDLDTQCCLLTALTHLCSLPSYQDVLSKQKHISLFATSHPFSPVFCPTLKVNHK